MGLLVYHNGECSKCKELTEILNNAGQEVQYKFYLHEPMSVEELKTLLQKLDVPVAEIVRRTEPQFEAEYAGKELSENEWLQVIIDNPVFLQRPIVVSGDKAIIARPAQKVLEIL